MKTFTPRADALCLYPENERDVRELLDMESMGMGRLDFPTIGDAQAPAMRLIVHPQKGAK